VFKRVQDRLVLRADADHVAAACRGQHAGEGKVVALSGAAGEDNLLRGSADKVCHLLAGVLDSLKRRGPGRVATCGIREHRREERLHSYYHTGITRCRGVAVEVHEIRRRHFAGFRSPEN
jgi:hypothetical protein